MRNRKEDQGSVFTDTEGEKVDLALIGQYYNGKVREFEKLRKIPCIGQVVNLRTSLLEQWPRLVKFKEMMR